MKEGHADVEKLEYYYNQVNKQLLNYQSLTHGLFPLSIHDKTKFEGHVRDNVYCATAIWALALAHRHIDDDNGKTFELEQSAVKCMRGLLFFYMQQADKVEAFKTDQQSINSLACKFNINTVDVIIDAAYQDLQIDVIALYLLTMVQMISSGLNIIFTIDEVQFIQNLVYYIERTYRIADYGMWGRGTKYNDGHSELNASSIGMVKAALEAINGCNLFGSKGSISSVIYVDSDAHHRNTAFLQALLPRESKSKTTDAALLTIIGFPGFAVDDVKLREETKERLMTRLNGRFGLKRFERDGYGNILESNKEMFYEKSQLMQFDGIESEWPIFYIYLALEAIFAGDTTGGEYMTKLQSLLTYDETHGTTVPKYYYVPKDDIELERKCSGESIRWPNEEVENMFLWGQSLYIIANILSDKLISVHELDPISRSSYSNARYNYGQFVNRRYSSFTVGASDLIVQVCLIAQNRSLQANLATYGIEAQTPKEIEPIVICSPHDLIQVYEELGKNSKLKLSGRPNRPFGSLGTSKIYKILGKIVVTYPIILDETDFYMSLDMSLLINELKRCLVFIRQYWNMRGRPTVCFLLKDHNFRGTHSSKMVDFMAQLKTGNVEGVKVKLGRLQTLTSTGCVEHLDYLKPQHCAKISVISNENDEGYFINLTGFESVYTPVLSCGYESEDENSERLKPLDQLATSELIEKLLSNSSLHMKMTILQILLKREGPAFSIDGQSLNDYTNDVYLKACYVHNWSVVRHGACLLNKSVPSLAPSITAMLVGGKQVTIGAFGQREHIITEPLTPAAIIDIIYDTCMEYDPREVSLQQEMVIYLAGIIATRPQLFKGMLKIRIGWILKAMKKHLTSCKETLPGKSGIYTLYPNEVLHLATAILSGKGCYDKCNIDTNNIFARRSLEGALNRLPKGFYRKVWDILERVKGLKLKEHLLLSDSVLSEMTSDETVFKISVENILSAAQSPVDRQIIVELVVILWTVLSRNPEVQIPQVVHLDDLVEYAIKLFMNDRPDKAKEDFLMLDSTVSNGSMAYLTRAILIILMNQPFLINNQADTCHIS